MHVRPTKMDKWELSEEVAMGVIVATASGMHLKLVDRYEEGPLWCAIERSHLSTDASLRREAWVDLFNVRKQHDEGYTDYRRGEAHNSKIDRVTPTLTREEMWEERLMTQLLYGLPTDDPLRRQFITQSSLAVADMWAAFLRTDRDAPATAAIKSANAAFAGASHRREQRGHLAKDCPFVEYIRRAVNARLNASKKKGKGRSLWTINKDGVVSFLSSPVEPIDLTILDTPVRMPPF